MKFISQNQWNTLPSRHIHVFVSGADLLNFLWLPEEGDFNVPGGVRLRISAERIAYHVIY